MCFAPQRRTLFRHRNSYKRSWAEVFCTFWLRNVLRAVCFVHFDLEMCLTACNFSSLIWPAGDASASLLSTLRGDKSLEKHSVSRLSCLFAHLDLLSSETFSFLIFFLLSSSLLFSSLLFSDSSHLCLSSVNIVGNLTSELSSTISNQIKSYCIIT